MREIQLRWSWKTHDFLSGILEAPTCRKLESVLLVAAGFPPPQRIVQGKKWRNSWNLEITKVQVQGKMFDISEQKIAQLVSGCGWLSFFNIYHLFLQVNDGIILKLKVLVPVNFLWHHGSRGRLGREIEGPRDTWQWRAWALLLLIWQSRELSYARALLTQEKSFAPYDLHQLPKGPVLRTPFLKITRNWKCGLL